MALFNYAAKEITLKVVYYGPGLCGKTTNLQKLHTAMSPDKKSKLLSLSTESDRTLFFDFMPIALGKVKDFEIKFQLYTVPGQVRYNATRKLVLKGADAVVFVADSQEAMREQNMESLENMKENLLANNLNPDDIPMVLQYNKRDLKNILPVEELDRDMNPDGDRIIEAAAINGTGVEETFRLITSRLLSHISKKHNVKIEGLAGEELLSEPPVAKKPLPREQPAAESKEAFVIERSGVGDTMVQPAAPETFEERPLTEAEIEESILRTSFPESPAEVPDWPAEVPEAPAEIPEEPEPITAVPTEAPEEVPEMETGGETPQTPEILMMVLEELRESRKQQAEILETLKKIELKS